VQICVKFRCVLRLTTPLAAVLLAACASSDATQPGAKPAEIFATPDWAKANQARAETRRAITQADLINPDGSCAMPQTTDGMASPSLDAADALAGQGQLPVLAGGVALGMTECEVLQRTGTPDTFNIANEGTVRIATVTVTQGPSPGLYRFRDGRLITMERVQAPPPARPARPARPQRAAKQGQQQGMPMPLRGPQQ